MTRLLDDFECCGIRELSPIQRHTPEKIIIEQLEDHYYWSRNDVKSENDWPANFRFVVFSQAGSNSEYGEKLNAFILENKLGTTVETEKAQNPNSHRMLKVWVWTVDHRAVKSWIRRYLKNHKEEEA